MGDYHSFYVITGLVMSLLLSTMFPQTVGYNSFDENKAEQIFTMLTDKDQQYYIESGFFNEDGTVGENFETVEELNNVGNNENRLIITELTFGFLDYVGLALRNVFTIFTFLFSFIILLFRLPSPLGGLVGGVGLYTYIYSLVRFIIGR